MLIFIMRGCLITVESTFLFSSSVYLEATTFFSMVSLLSVQIHTERVLACQVENSVNYGGNN